MGKPASREVSEALLGRAAEEAALLRGAAGWCRRLAERLGRHPPRPHLQNAVQAFLRHARGFDREAAAVQAAFGPPEGFGPPEALEKRRVAVVVGRSAGRSEAPPPQERSLSSAHRRRAARTGHRAEPRRFGDRPLGGARV